MDVAGELIKLSGVQEHPDLPGVRLLPTRLMRAAAQVLPVAGASIGMFPRYRRRAPLGASDENAVLAERWEFTVGDGPCLTAHAQLRPVLAPEPVLARRWPAFHRELISRTPFRSIYSVPITAAGLGGEVAMDLYYTCSDLSLTPAHRQDITDVTDAIIAALAAESGLADPRLPRPKWFDNEPVQTRTGVWTATDMISSAWGLLAPDALSVLRAFAFSHASTLDDIARSLTTQQLPIQALLG